MLKELHLNTTIIIGYYAIIDIMTFILYAIDKWAAVRGFRRVPEFTLNLFSLIGGWPGALASRHLLRHKTQKQPFRLIFGITVIINCLVLVWLLKII